ncbi:transglycosylase SLT domain-containing protein [Candidatus Dojkabacteria bacterium]|nr:transglycosylase SLT domain-containing protein [Candidatus Dojkabacteria bacterium]
MKIKANLTIHLKRGRINVIKRTFKLNKVIRPTYITLGFFKLLIILLFDAILILNNLPTPKVQSFEEAYFARANVEDIYLESIKYAESKMTEEADEESPDMDIVRNGKIGRILLGDKYKKLAGSYYYPNVEKYLPIVDKVLSEKGLDQNSLFIQAMFFIGQRESHWQTGSVSGATYGGENAVGIFQFLPSTFRSVSRGNIYSAEDQVRAFVTMVERGRVREFGTLYLPGINSRAKQYVLNYR